MPSFDIVNKFEMQEVENAVNMVKREINNRYDFKGSNTTIIVNKKENFINLESNSEIQLNSTIDILEKRAINRGLSIKIFNHQNIEKSSGMTVRKKILLQEGISKEQGKKINKMIKNMKLKVQTQIQDEQLRVSAKKIDDLQNIISMLKEEFNEIPLQFVNIKK
tara:strand:+ start:138 stop:629 length:492 start_codon:yes stop_codon:yes gene_type:complete